MKKILIITGRYLPGYKDGGPVRTIKNLTDILSDKYNFTIMCADRDHGDNKAYDGITYGEKNRVGNADVYYVKDGKYSFSDIKGLSEESDLVYVCGPYNDYAIKTLILNRLSLIKCPLVLAPMGSFSKGALAIKSRKKQIFLSLIKLLNLFKNVVFSVTSEVEKTEMKEAMGLNNKCFVAEDPQRNIGEAPSHDLFKKDGILNLVFLSRISEKKNLLGTAEILKNVHSRVKFCVYGTMEDAEYFEKCKEKLSKLPENISFSYMGEAESEKVPMILSGYDAFLFPTHGENFGHVISEALMAGCIPVISDTTPWLDFEKYKSGYVIKHEDYSSFAECIDMLAEKSEEELKKISDNAKDYYIRKYEEQKTNNGYVRMFDELL